MLTREKLIEILRDGQCFLQHDLFTNEAGLAHLLGLTPRTLRNWREVGNGPRAHYTSRVLYDIDEIVRWYNDFSTQRSRSG